MEATLKTGLRNPNVLEWGKWKKFGFISAFIALAVICLLPEQPGLSVAGQCMIGIMIFAVILLVDFRSLLSCFCRSHHDLNSALYRFFSRHQPGSDYRDNGRNENGSRRLFHHPHSAWLVLLFFWPLP